MGRTCARLLGTLLALLGVAGAMLAVAPAPAAAGGAVVSLVEPSRVVDVGESVRFTIKAEGVTDLAGYDVRLQYDEDTLEFVSFQNGAFLGAGGRPVSCPLPLSPDPEAGDGSVRFGCGTIGDSPPGIDGTGLLGAVTFRALAPGTTDVVFTKLELANPAGDDCCGTPDVLEAAVTVVGEGDSAPPPPTPEPDPSRRARRARSDTPDPNFYYTLPESDGTTASPGSDGTGLDGTSPGSSASGSGRGTGPAAGVLGAGSGSEDFPVAGYGTQQSGDDAPARNVAFSIAAGGGLMIMLGVLAKRRRDT
ncbi:MAG: cohesin domain-containing protein [Dehalococcoidia bacterium]